MFAAYTCSLLHPAATLQHGINGISFRNLLRIQAVPVPQGLSIEQMKARFKEHGALGGFGFQDMQDTEDLKNAVCACSKRVFEAECPSPTLANTVPRRTRRRPDSSWWSLPTAPALSTSRRIMPSSRYSLAGTPLPTMCCLVFFAYRPASS